MRLFKTSTRINLALQGGGAHGAFTWGVLDRLLQDPTLEIGWISGTSAGAINAVAVAAGFANRGRESGREAARETLHRVWAAVEDAGVPDMARLNPFLGGPFLAGLSRATAMTGMAALSPYEFNPLGFDPLRKLLVANIDFAAIRADHDDGELLIAATDVGTGQPRLFRRAELTVEAVLASACLPQLHHAVEIDGRAYWDGGYSANPDVTTLATESPVGDTMIVQLNPFDRETVPRTARAIAGQINTLTFNAPLLRDIAAIVAAQEDVARCWLPPRRSRASVRLGRHRFHLIEAGRHTSLLAPDSKAMPEAAMLARLFDAGRTETSRWLERHRADIGRRQTVDLRQRYLSPPRGRLAGSGAADGPGDGGPLDPGAALAEATGSKI